MQSSYVLVSRVECIHSIVNIYHNNEQTFLRTTEVKQCVLIPKIVKITKIALYYIFLHCMPCFLHCIALKWQSSRPIRNARKRKKECRGKEECPPKSDIKINPFYHSRCDVSTGQLFARFPRLIRQPLREMLSTCRSKRTGGNV